jgi:hypothetical protein
MCEPTVQVETLLKADKGRAAGQFAVPPIQYDGAGYPFAVCPLGNTIALCNDANLLLLNLGRRSRRLLRAPLGDQADFWGIAFALQNRLYAFLSDYTVAVLNLQGRLLQRFGGGFGTQPDQFEGAPPYRLAVHPDGTLLIHDGELLYLYSAEGKPQRRLSSIAGFAVDKQGYLWLQSHERRLRSESGKIRYVELPTVLQPEGSPQEALWQLFAGDRWGGVLWQRDIFRDQMLVTEVARTKRDGTLSWRVSLNGREGVLRDLAPKSQVQWLTVDERGRLYVLGWTFRGVKRAVGLYRVSVSA